MSNSFPLPTPALFESNIVRRAQGESSRHLIDSSVSLCLRKSSNTEVKWGRNYARITEKDCVCGVRCHADSTSFSVDAWPLDALTWATCCGCLS